MELQLELLEQNKDFFVAYFVSLVSMAFFEFVDRSLFLYFYEIFIVVGFYFIFNKTLTHFAGYIRDILNFYEKASGNSRRNKILMLALWASKAHFLLGLLYFIWAVYYMTVILTDLLRTAVVILNQIVT